MVNNKHGNDDQNDVEVTNEESEMADMDLEEIETEEGDKIKSLRDKLKKAESEKREAQEEMQRSKADFLNAKRRMEEERLRDRIRSRKDHIEELLPLCDSFEMAMSNKEAWEKADKAWRAGMEGIHSQLTQLLNSYGVKTIDPKGEKFDPRRDEAIGTEEVENENEVDTVVSVVQLGYELVTDGESEIIRPARVTTGIIKN